MEVDVAALSSVEDEECEVMKYRNERNYGEEVIRPFTPHIDD